MIVAVAVSIGLYRVCVTGSGIGDGSDRSIVLSLLAKKTYIKRSHKHHKT